MSSHRLGVAPKPDSKTGILVELLDPAFGYFVWAAHFLAIYIAAAVACVLGLGGAGAGAQAKFLTALALVTVAAIIVLVVHAVWRYRQQRRVGDQRFRMSVTIGNDAIAAVAVGWQFFPILLAPICA